MRCLILAAAVALAALMPVSGDTITPCDQVAGNLVQNCGFQSMDFSNYSVSAGPFTLVAYDPIALLYYAAFGDVDSNGTIRQNIATHPGGTYAISFYLSSDGGTPNNFSVSFGPGAPIYSATDIANENFVYLSFLAKATGNNTLLSFSGGNVPGFLDLNDISVVSTTAAVPEPGSVVLLATILMLMLGAPRLLQTRRSGPARSSAPRP